MDDLDQQIQAFLSGAPHAVLGASTDRQKYGNKVLRCFLQHDRPALPVNPTATQIEGQIAYPDIASLPEGVHGVSIITSPPVTEKLVKAVIAAGIRHVWMQPGAESQAAIDTVVEAGLYCIAGGPCLLVAFGYHEDDPS